MDEVSTSPPSGTVTMLFTDIEGSTTTARRLGTRWAEVLGVHHNILERAIRAHRGFIEARRATRSLPRSRLRSRRLRPFTLEDAEAIAGGDVLDGLEALIEFSFVRRVATHDQAGRFTMAQSLRESGRERLAGTEQLDAARKAHADWVIARVEAEWEQIVADAEVSPLRGLADDTRAALEFLRARDPALHLRLSGAFVMATSDNAASVSLAKELDHAIAAKPKPDPALARATLAAGQIATVRGQNDAAHARASGGDRAAVGRAARAGDG